jgi:hypothetical protein
MQALIRDRSHAPRGRICADHNFAQSFLARAEQQGQPVQFQYPSYSNSNSIPISKLFQFQFQFQ